MISDAVIAAGQADQSDARPGQGRKMIGIRAGGGHVADHLDPAPRVRHLEMTDRERVLSWHQRIIDAIAAHDAEAASAAMIEVIYNGRRRHALAVERTDRE